jgi:hypothetical protein
VLGSLGTGDGLKQSPCSNKVTHSRVTAVLLRTDSSSASTFLQRVWGRGLKTCKEARASLRREGAAAVPCCGPQWCFP